MARPYTRKGKRWTEKDDALMMRLFETRATEEDFQRYLGVSKQAAYTHKAYLKRINKYGGTSHKSHLNVRADARPDEAALQAAKLREIAPRSVTAWLQGDPPPGYHEARAQIERQARNQKEMQRAKTADAQKEKESSP